MKIYCADRNNSDLALVKKVAGKDIWVKVWDIDRSLYNINITRDDPEWQRVRTFSWIKILSIESVSSAPGQIFVRICYVDHNPYVEYPRKMFRYTYREITERLRLVPISCIKFVQPVELASTDELFTIKAV